MNDIHDMPMLGDVWRYARDAYRSKDPADATACEELGVAIRGFAAKGNAAKTARRTARAKAVADDPMNPTSHARIDIEEKPQTTAVDADLEAGEEEAWPNRGGFRFIADELDEVRGRLED